MTAKPSRHWSKCRACHKRVYAPAQRCECGGEPYASVEWARAGNVTALRTFEELVESAMAAARLLPRARALSTRICLDLDAETHERLRRMPGAVVRHHHQPAYGQTYYAVDLVRDGVEVTSCRSWPSTPGEFGAHGVSEFLRVAGETAKGAT